MRTWMMMGAGLLWAVLATGTSPGMLWATPQAAQQKPPYTMSEYNAYKAADAEQNPQLKIKKLDDFVKQYTNSALLPYVYRDFYLTNWALKNFAGTIEYCDRQLALGDKVDTQGRLEASVARAQAFLVGSASDKSLQTPDAQGKARDAAVAGLKILDEWKKPEQMAADQYEQQKKGFLGLFNSVAAAASYGLKDYAAAIGYYKAVLAANPNDAISHFRLGVAYLEMTPPQGNEGFWQLARSIALKAPNEQQVRTYLRNQLIRYQQTACDKLIDDQVNEIITLAGSSADRPATLTIPSAADLQKARADTANFIPALMAGGDAGKVMWLASCGLDYQDVGVWAMNDAVADGDTITIRVYRPTSQDPDAAQKEINAATGPNMEIKITGQPEAIRIKKDDQFRFSGTLTGYSQNPFLLTWDKAKINPEDIPDEKAGPGKRAPRRTPAKKASDD
jgi:hypothetical protein